MPVPHDGFISTSYRCKKNKEKWKICFYCSVSQIHINPEKNTKKPIQITFCEHEQYIIIYMLYSVLCDKIDNSV